MLEQRFASREVSMRAPVEGIVFVGEAPRNETPQAIAELHVDEVEQRSRLKIGMNLPGSESEDRASMPVHHTQLVVRKIGYRQA